MTHADLGRRSGGAWYEIVVDGRGRVFVDGATGIVALVAPGFRCALRDLLS